LDLTSSGSGNESNSNIQTDDDLVDVETVVDPNVDGNSCMSIEDAAVDDVLLCPFNDSILS
jgi:hypothetical protein